MNSEDDGLQRFIEERSCIYRGEHYAARDNGAVLRRASSSRRRPLDDVWTFGAPSAQDGYMTISVHKVHRIVATAFHGEQPSSGHIVDHIDTNRRNNRPENLRWVTRLENILLNPVTAKRVVALYGSIEEFLADPRNPKNGKPTADYEWMRSVTLEEAAYSRERLAAWAASPRPSRGGGASNWILRPPPAVAESRDPASTVQSKTPGAVQRKWRVPAEFPLCPDPRIDLPLDTYFERLRPGAVAVISPYGETKVGTAVRTSDGSALLLLGEHGAEAIKPWSLAKVTLENGQFVHESMGTFFEREGAEKYLTLAQGLAWEGGEVFDDFA